MSTAVTAERQAILQTPRDFCGGGDPAPRHGVGRGAGVPARSLPQARRARLSRRDLPGGVRRGRPLLHRLRRRSSRRSRAWTARSALARGAHIARLEPHLPVRHGGAAAQYMPEARLGRVARGLGPDRGRGGLRLGRHEDDGRPRRRLLGPERLEELHHERLGRQRRGPDGRDRPLPRATTASRPSSSSSTTRASAWARRRTSSACAPPTPARSSWRTAGSRPRTSSARRATGFVDSMKILDGGRISIAALAVGMARGAYEAALQVLEGAPAVRPADLRVRGDPVLPRRDGDRRSTRRAS